MIIDINLIVNRFFWRRAGSIERAKINKCIFHIYTEFLRNGCENGYFSLNGYLFYFFLLQTLKPCFDPRRLIINILSHLNLVYFLPCSFAAFPYVAGSGRVHLDEDSDCSIVVLRWRFFGGNSEGYFSWNFFGISCINLFWIKYRWSRVVSRKLLQGSHVVSKSSTTNPYHLAWRVIKVLNIVISPWCATT